MTERLFVGVFPSSDVQREVAAVHEELDDRPRGRWVRPDLLHLTLCFLGDCEPGSLPPIAAALDRTAARHAPFELELQGLGAFPNRRRARVAYVAASRGEESLAAIAETLLDELPSDVRPDDDKPFRAHLTIARFRDAPSSTKWDAVEAAYASRVEPWRVRIEELRLVKSALSAQGPRYETRHRARLAGG